MKTLTITAAAVVLLGAPAAFAQDRGQQNDHHGGQGGGQHESHAQPQGRGGPPQGPQGGRPAGPPQGGPAARPNFQPYAQPNAQPNARWQGGQGGRPGAQWQGGAAPEQRRGGPFEQGSARPQFQGQPSGEGREGRWQGPGEREQFQGRGGERFEGRGDRGQAFQGRGDEGRGHEWRPRGDRDRWQEWRRDDRFRDYQRNVFAQRRFRLGAYYWPRGWGYHRWSYGEFLPEVFFSQDYWIDDYADYGLPFAPDGTVWVRYGPDALLIDQYTGEIIQVVYGLFY